MKVLPLAFAAATVLAAAPSAMEQTKPVERGFAKGGAVRLELVSGDYRILGGHDDKIRVSWWTNEPIAAEKVRTEVDVRGNTATVRTDAPKNSGLHFDIDVPERCDLDVDLSAGDLRVTGVEGNKRLEMWAGDVTIDVGRAEQYRQVEGSVRFGDISAPPFNVSKGGIFRAFTWTGAGKYTMKAHLFAGDLKLR